MVSGLLTVESAYDGIAPLYDERHVPDFWVRLLLWDVYERCFQAGETVLDAGCGTGIDSRFLAERGVRVIAADASPGMLAQVGCDPGIQPLLLDLNHAGAFRPGTLDGIVMAFAPFNTVRDPAGFARQAAEQLRPGGSLIIHALGRHSVWDLVPLIARGNAGAVRLLLRRRWLTVEIAGQTVRHRLYDPLTLYRRVFSDRFELRSARGIGALRPPEGARVPWVASALLESAESRWGGHRLFRSWGRFVLLELRRR